MALIYRPDHPAANENGMIDARRAPRREGAFVISDEIAPTRHMCDGKYYTSKAKFRQTTRDFDCVEVGNETGTLLKPRKPIMPDRKQRRDDIRQAIHDLKNGRRRDY